MRPRPPRDPRRAARANTRAIYLATAALAPLPVLAAPADWIARSGEWSIPDNWNGRAIPVAGQDANIVHNDDFERTVTYDYAGPNIALNTLTLDQRGRPPLQLSQRNFRLETTQTIVAQNGHATFVQGGGTHFATLAVQLGAGAEGHGTYEMSGGTLLSDDIFVGALGRGTFIQTGGAVNPSAIQIGDQPSAVGTYQLDKGSISTAGVTVGNQGAGTFVQTGGSLQNSIRITLAMQPGSTGNFQLDNGTVNTSTLVVGRSGTGAFVQNGGSHTVSFTPAGSFVLADQPGAAGDYTLNAGSLTVAGGTEVGHRGRGNLTISGGTANFAHINVGYPVNASGTVTVNAGTLNLSGSLRLGGSGHGRYLQTGGTVTIAGSIAVDATDFVAPGSGTLHITGGTLNITGTSGSGDLVMSSQSGTVIHEGNALISAKQVYVGSNQGPGDAGLYRFNGGDLIAQTLHIRSGGTFEQNGGNLNATSILHDGGTVAGTLISLNTYTYNSGEFPGKLVNEATVILNNSPTFGNGLENLSAFAIPLSKAVTLNGFSRNLGQFTLDGGNLVTNNSFFNVGTMTAHGMIYGAGTFRNLSGARLTQGPGDLSLRTDGQHINDGTFDLAPGRFLSLTGGPLTNNGVLNLNGAKIQGSATLVNGPGGLMTGLAVIGVDFVNRGKFILDPGATVLQLASTNSGSIVLDSPASKLDGGGRINNIGSILGRGTLSSPVDNHGIVEAMGGVLTVGAATRNFNQFPDGTVAAAAGAQLHLTNGLGTNAGTILLTGGTVHDFGTALQNAPTGKIRGQGVFRSPQVNNAGEIAVSFGNLDFDAPLANSATGKVIVTGGGNATFHKPVSGVAGAEIRTSANSAAVFLAPVTGPINFTGTGAKYFEAGASAVGPVAAGGATFVLESASLTADRIRENSLTVDGNVNLRPSGTPANASEVNALTINPGGKLDLTNNALLVDYAPSAPSPIQEVRTDLRAGALTSSTTITNPNTTLAYGEAPTIFDFSTGPVTYGDLTLDTTTLFIKLAIKGDANLDGKVSFPDLVALAQNYNTTTGNAVWTTGDFTYDGNVTFPDLVLLAQNYNTTLLPAPIPGSSPGFEDDFAKALAQVPEPSLVSPLAFLAYVLAGRSRRSRLSRQLSGATQLMPNSDGSDSCGSCSTIR